MPPKETKISGRLTSSPISIEQLRNIIKDGEEKGRDVSELKKTLKDWEERGITHSNPEMKTKKKVDPKTGAVTTVISPNPDNEDDFKGQEKKNKKKRKRSGRAGSQKS